jgi:hypothetical protein
LHGHLGQLVLPLDTAHKAIAQSGNRFNIGRLIRRIAQHQPQLVDRRIHVRVVVHERSFRPQFFAQCIARHHFAGLVQQRHQRLEHFPGQTHFSAVLKKQFPLRIQLESAKTEISAARY